MLHASESGFISRLAYILYITMEYERENLKKIAQY